MNINTVKPPNKGHIGNNNKLMQLFGDFREVVLF